MGKTLLYFLIVIVIILIAGLGLLLFQNQRLLAQLIKQTPSPSPSAITSPSPTSAPVTSPSPTITLSQVQENIEAAINSKNFAPLASYMTKPKVNFSLMSSECCQPMTPDEAVTNMKYINDAIPMDFNQEADLIKNLKAKNSQLANTYIGISKTKKHLAAFTIDNSNRISAIQLAVTWELYAQ